MNQVDGDYTKHIYIGSQRTVSKLGDLDSYGQDPRRIAYAGSVSIDFTSKYKEAQETVKDRYTAFEVECKGSDNDDYVNGGGFCCDDAPGLRAGAIGNGNDNPEIYQYYYHSDHLGSTSLITNLDGEVVQHVEYVPFGEVFIEERNNRWNTPYLFNAKELDEETGLYYYGARYYDSRNSVFLGVDPMWEKYPGISVFAYCGNNPIRYTDPDGQEPTPAEAARMAAHVYGDKKNGILTGGWQVSSRDFGIKLQDATGLKSQVYQRMKADGNLEYTYATAGTEASWKDVGADVKQPFGLSKQYASAASNAKDLSKALGETELTFTGHSLGGGEAALNALVTDRKAITFNAAGVSDITKFVEGTWKTPFKSEKNIDAYIMITDPLNNIQNNTTLPDVNGRRHYLLPTDASSIYNGHSMDNVLKNFGVKNPDE